MLQPNHQFRHCSLKAIKKVIVLPHSNKAWYTQENQDNMLCSLDVFCLFSVNLHDVYMRQYIPLYWRSTGCSLSFLHVLGIGFIKANS